MLHSHQGGTRGRLVRAHHAIHKRSTPTLQHAWLRRLPMEPDPHPQHPPTQPSSDHPRHGPPSTIPHAVSQLVLDVSRINVLLPHILKRAWCSPSAVSNAHSRCTQDANASNAAEFYLGLDSVCMFVWLGAIVVACVIGECCMVSRTMSRCARSRWTKPAT
jgi:hypothetical protein